MNIVLRYYGKSRMIITHRFGEPEEMAGKTLLGNLGSFNGIQIADKALVSEDHLIEIADCKRIFKSNEVYDAIKTPR